MTADDAATAGAIVPAERLRRLFDAPVAAFEVRGTPTAEWLDAGEAALVARGADKRRREFAGGRACARRALAALDAPSAALLVAAERAPAWPAGWVGSITHAAGYCGAVACSTATYA